MEVHGRWEGGESTGAAACWADSWVGVTWLTADVIWRVVMEVQQYGVTAATLQLRRRWCTSRAACGRSGGKIGARREGKEQSQVDS